ncbi:MAG TPA: citrate lyase holo-[acyl-carrier protein] synthase [candidate division Zixibacteria bacterium]|nr:citrate lyase holo-[acyl-carrier protein] synthase [candidate division Zixibacteria bacterium]
MNNLELVRKKILDAKEQRWIKQLAFLKKYRTTICSFKFNVPSWPKESPQITKAWEKALIDFEFFLKENKINYEILEKNQTILGPEAFLKTTMNSSNFKKWTIKFEENYVIGRLIDIDVLDINAKPIEREIKRKCFICNDLAIICIRANKHTPEEVRKIFDLILRRSIS